MWEILNRIKELWNFGNRMLLKVRRKCFPSPKKHKGSHRTSLFKLSLHIRHYSKYSHGFPSYQIFVHTSLRRRNSVWRKYRKLGGILDLTKSLERVLFEVMDAWSLMVPLLHGHGWVMPWWWIDYVVSWRGEIIF